MAINRVFMTTLMNTENKSDVKMGACKSKVINKKTAAKLHTLET